MAKDSFTFVLNGQVTLDELAKAMDKISRIIKGLEAEKSKKSKINWVVEALEASSAIATIRGESQQPEDLPVVEQVVNDYENVGRSMQYGEEIKHSDEVRRAAK